MKRRQFLLPLALLAALLVAAVAGAATQTVQITKSGFTPANVTISVGDTVTWHNADTADHQIVANDGSFASPVLHADQSYSHAFSNAGKVAYHDALAKTHAGTVTVNGPSPAITLVASSKTIVYGSGATLTGQVNNQLTGGEPVSLTAQAFGKSIQSLDATTTSSTGTYSFAVSPTIQTTYQTHWRTADSDSQTIDVAPRVGFGQSGRIYTATVTSDLSYAGHYVWLQKRTNLFGWTNVKRVTLSSSSAARFMVQLPNGRTMLRLVLPAGQAGAGYVAGLSRTLVIKH